MGSIPISDAMPLPTIRDQVYETRSLGLTPSRGAIAYIDGQTAESESAEAGIVTQCRR